MDNQSVFFHQEYGFRPCFVNVVVGGGGIVFFHISP